VGPECPECRGCVIQPAAGHALDKSTVDGEAQGLMLKVITEPSTALRGLNEKVDALVNVSRECREACVCVIATCITSRRTRSVCGRS
jgi:hypothetical protein